MDINEILKKNMVDSNHINLDKAIKEIVQETLRMAAEDAEITLQNDGFIDYRAISEDSITNVINKIKF